MGSSRFYAALAALLFTAACAWFGAAVFRSLPPAEAAASPAPTPVAGRFRGIVLRRELVLPADALPEAREGERLSAGETGVGSALFFAGTDGLETLSPADAEPLTAAAVEGLLAQVPAEDAASGRLVLGRELYIAALWEGDEAPTPGGCRLRLDSGEVLRAGLLRVTVDAGGRAALLLRLPLGDSTLLTTRFTAGEITF